MKIIIDEPVLVYSPPVNEDTSKWGVYAIPKMWKNHTGELVVRFNGEQDSGLTEQRVPNVYFASKDDGRTWTKVDHGDERYDTAYFIGINPSFTTLKNGDIVGLRHRNDLAEVPSDLPYEAEFVSCDGSMVLRAYKYADLPKECVDIEWFRKHGEEITLSEINYDFPDRLVCVAVKGWDGQKQEFADRDRRVQTNIFLTPFFSAVTELDDGTLLAVTHGQHPGITDRQCEEAYLIASTDGGITWRKRSTIASDTVRKTGCVGDGGEISLTKSTNGNLICAMRTDKAEDSVRNDTLVCVSADQGFTWSEPTAVADSDVTPHVVALDHGIVVLVYGRPGVHFKVSGDNGLTWSGSYSIIGETMGEEMLTGKRYEDFMYLDSISYSNTYVEKLSEDTILILYNHLKYDDGDGQKHKAGFVRAVTVTQEEDGIAKRQNTGHT